MTAGLIFYLLKPEFLKSPVKSNPQTPVQTAAPAHQGHTAESKEPQAQVETQQKEQAEETPTVEIPFRQAAVDRRKNNCGVCEAHAENYQNSWPH